MDRKRLTDLSNEILFSGILLDRDSLKWLLDDLQPGEYMILTMTGKMEKAYLQSLNYMTQFGLPAISKIAGSLKDKGLVTWTHDGDGSEGTYLMLTQAGADRLKQMEEMTAFCFEKIIEQFGEDKCREFASMARRMAQLLREEIRRREVNADVE